MIRQTQPTHGPTFKARVALAAIRGDKTLAELAKAFDVASDQIQAWRDHLLDGAPKVFEACPKAASDAVATQGNLPLRIARQEVFCQHYRVDMNGAAAARRAGYSP